jgi:hypothetical protein
MPKDHLCRLGARIRQLHGNPNLVENQAPDSTHQTTALASSFIDPAPLQGQRQEPDFQRGQSLTSANPTVGTADSDSTTATLAAQHVLADMGLNPNTMDISGLIDPALATAPLRHIMSDSE